MDERDEKFPRKTHFDTSYNHSPEKLKKDHPGIFSEATDSE